MILIPAGQFLMGSPAGVGKDDEQPRHLVWVDAFYIDSFPVTFAQYDQFCAAAGRDRVDDQGWGRGDRPVINVTWFEAQAYCQWAGKRLCTEAEWERACRAGSDQLYFFGSEVAPLDQYAWYRDNSGGRTQPVAKKRPNPFGLFDMHGNVWEWCEDWYAEDYYARSPECNPVGPLDGEFRVLRGGSWRSDADGVRAGHRRDYGNPETRENVCGFRCALTLVEA